MWWLLALAGFVGLCVWVAYSAAADFNDDHH